MSQPQATPTDTPVAVNDLEIWVVLGGIPSEKFAEGFLLTTRNRFPRCIAYVNRADPPGLFSARRIASGKAGPDTEEDLRHGSIPERFARKMLIPLDHIEGRNTDCVAAQFIQHGTDFNFAVFSNSGFKAILERVTARAGANGETEGQS